MLCLKCNYNPPDNAIFCPKCGKKLDKNSKENILGTSHKLIEGTKKIIEIKEKIKNKTRITAKSLKKSTKKAIINPITLPLEIAEFIADTFDEDIFIKYFEEIEHKLEILIKKSEILIKKSDENIVKEIYGGINAINDSFISENHQTCENRLKYAEEMFLRNVNLNPELITADRPNNYWMCLCCYGLFYISFLKQDEKLMVKYFLKICELEPRMARKELLTKFYTKYIMPKCYDLYEWYNENRRCIEDNDNPAIEFFNNLGLSKATLWFKNNTYFLSLERRQKLEELTQIFEKALDEKCISIGKQCPVPDGMAHAL